MNRPAPDRFGLFVFILCAAAFVVQIGPRLTGDTLVMDEEWDLSNAIHYWKDLDASVKNGPLPVTGSLLGLPSLFFPLQMKPMPPDVEVESRAYFFFYYLNRDRLDNLVASCRAFCLLFGLAWGWMIYRMAASKGRVFLSVALLLWAFDPLIVGYSGVAKNDIPAAALALAALLTHQRSRQNRKAGSLFWVGLLSGMAILTKMTNLFLIPSIIALEAVDARLEAHREALGGAREGMVAFSRRFGIFMIGMAAWFFAAYLPTTILVPPHLQPFDLFGRYIQWSLPHASRQVSPYWFGRERSSLAFMAFPVSVFFKWTLPFTILTLTGIFLGIRRRIQWPEESFIPVAALILLIVPNMSSKLCRHLLPVYPFFILAAAGAAEWIWGRIKDKAPLFLRAAAVFLIFLWHPLTAAANFPHALSYMNDLVPRQRKVFFLSGYNWDFNQDVKRLVKVARERGWGNVKLGNSARVDPYFYGLFWMQWTKLDLESPQPGTVYVLNASLFSTADSFLQDFAAVKKSWAASTPPSGWVADTWMFFEVPGTAANQDSPRLNSFPYFRYDLIPYRMAMKAEGRL